MEKLQIFQPSETKLIRYVTPQEIVERTGGNMALGEDAYTTDIEFGHTKRLRVLVRRAHQQAPERLSSIDLPNGMHYSFNDANAILRPDSVTFIIPIRSERLVSPNQAVEVTITKKGFSHSTFSA